MRVAKRMLLCLLLCLAAVLCGCAGGEENSGETDSRDDILLRAPAAEVTNQALLETAYTYLGRGITLKYPLGDSSSTPFFWWDTDGDGSEELLVLYQNTAKSKNVQLAVLRPGLDGSWYAAHMDVEGVGGEVAPLQALQLAGGQRCLLAAYQDATGRDWTLCLYRWQNGALQECERLVCQQYTVQDLDGDGCQQIALVQVNDTHGLLQLRVYGGTRTDDDTLPLLMEQSFTTLDARFERCEYLAYSCIGEEQTLVMDFDDGSGGRLAEVVTYRRDRFIRCYTPDDSNIPNYTSRPFNGVTPMDIDGDGAIELPRLESRVVSSVSNTRFCFVSWHAIGAHKDELKSYCFVDSTAGYLQLLPVEWLSKVMLQPAGGSVWSLRDLGEGQELLSFQMMAGGRAPAGYRLQGDLGRQQMYVQFSQQLTQDQTQLLSAGFIPLYK